MTGSLRYRSGSWTLTYQVDGRRHYATLKAPNNRTGRRAAETELARLITQAHARQVDHRTMTVTELLDRWLDHRQPTPGRPGGLADRTWATYESIVRRHLTPTLGPTRLAKLRPYDIDQLIRTLRHQGYAEKTVFHIRNTLHAALNQAVRWGWLTTNPCDATETVDPHSPEINVPTTTEVRAGLAAAETISPDFADLAHLAASTGHRRGSLAGLRWADLDGATLTFQRAIAATRGQLVVKPTKARTVARVTLEPPLAARLQAMRARHAEAALACGHPLPPDAYLFTSRPEGDRPWHPNSISHMWARAARAAGVGHVDLHHLKHYCCTQLLANGVPVWEVAQRTGTSPRTIERVYGHWIPDVDAAASEVMARLLG